LSYRNKTFLLILIATLIRCVIAIVTELGNDEVYYCLYSRHLQWNYFDHPPIVGWLIRLTTCNLLFNSEFFIRAGAIISCAIVTWLVYKCGKKLANDYAGFLAALIYTATIYGSIIAGTFILPDSPQMIFWTGGLYLLIGIVDSPVIDHKKIKNVLWFGVFSGLGMLCKIHTTFLWFGFILYVMIYNRLWLKQWSLYVSVIITIIFFIPVIKWNIDNHFITFTYHGNRVNIIHGGIDLDNFFSFAAGQVLYCNPIIFVCLSIALWHNKFSILPAQKKLLLLTSLPLIVIATAISFFKTVLPHWTGPAYTSLVLLTACYFAEKKTTVTGEKRSVTITISSAIVLLLVIIVLGIAAINFFPGTIGNKNIDKKGDGDFTLDMYGWKNFSQSFDSIYQSTHQTLDKNIQTIILCNKWFPAAHIDHYVAAPLQLKVFTEGSIEDIHQYYWLNKQRGPLKDSLDIYVIIPSNYYSDIGSFGSIKNFHPDKIIIVPQYRNGIEARRFTVYYFKPRKYIFATDN